MGLLDDAIREHLELKRRRGADPGEIALEERAALDPVYRSQDAAAEGPGGADEPTDTHPVAEVEDDEVIELGLREDAAGEAPGPDAPVAAQETVEIDMEAVLAAEDEHDGPQGDPLGAEAGADWHFPGADDEDGPPAPIPGQERMPFE